MLGSPPDDPMSIFSGGKLRPGTYNVQNLAGGTYLEVWESSKEVCCRPAAVLAPQHAVVGSLSYPLLGYWMLTALRSGNSRRQGLDTGSRRYLGLPLVKCAMEKSVDLSGTLYRSNAGRRINTAMRRESLSPDSGEPYLLPPARGHGG